MCLKKLGRRKCGIYKHERKITGEGMFVDKDKMQTIVAAKEWKSTIYDRIQEQNKELLQGSSSLANVEIK